MWNIKTQVSILIAFVISAITIFPVYAAQTPTYSPMLLTVNGGTSCGGRQCYINQVKVTAYYPHLEGEPVKETFLSSYHSNPVIEIMDTELPLVYPSMGITISLRINGIGWKSCPTKYLNPPYKSYIHMTYTGNNNCSITTSYNRYY
jgi:hypothetical protein